MLERAGPFCLEVRRMLLGVLPAMEEDIKLQTARVEHQRHEVNRSVV